MRVAAVAALLVHGAAFGAAVAEPLDRPALMARDPAAAVLLGADRAGLRIVAVGERGIVVCSDDEGSHWQQARVPVSSTLTAVRFVDAHEGWAVGHAGVVLHTDDAGSTWSKQLDGVVAGRLVLAAAEQRAAATPAGSAARPDIERVLRDAERLAKEGADKPWLDLAFTDPRHGIVVGAYGLALRTSDGGHSWRALLLDNPKALHLYAVRASGKVVLMAGEQGLLLRSDDGGETFTRLESPAAASWFVAEILPRGEFLIAGLRGRAFRSDDLGASWKPIAFTAPVSFVASHLQGERMWLANQAGTLFASADAARSWSGLQTPPLPPLAAVLPLGDGRLLTFGMGGAIAVAAARPALAEAAK